MGRRIAGKYQNRRSSRRRILQLLYAHEISGMPLVLRSVQAIRESFPRDSWKEDPDFTEGLVAILDLRLSAIDEAISVASPRWRIERMDRVTLSIIRSAAAEMMGMDTPRKVAINEAIELAKEFGAEDTPRFVNGVLDRLAKSL